MKIPHESQQPTFKHEYNSLLLQEIICFRLNNKVYHHGLSNRKLNPKKIKNNQGWLNESRVIQVVYRKHSFAKNTSWIHKYNTGESFLNYLKLESSWSRKPQTTTHIMLPSDHFSFVILVHFSDSDSTDESNWMPNNCIHRLFMACEVGADGILSSVRKNTSRESDNNVCAADVFKSAYYYQNMLERLWFHISNISNTDMGYTGNCILLFLQYI